MAKTIGSAQNISQSKVKMGRDGQSVTYPRPDAVRSDLAEAISVRQRAKQDLDDAMHDDSPKYVDAYQRAANLVRQLEKDRHKSLTEFTGTDGFANNAVGMVP